MKETKWKKLFLQAVFLCAFLLAFPSLCRAEEDRVIRVGYPLQEGFSERTEEGGYRGYTYDYLQEIAQYTNWEYEYVTPEGNLDQQLVSLLDMLEQGEIDLLGALVYSEDLARIYSYPEYSYGTGYITLSVLDSNVEFTEFNYSTFDNIRVAVYNGAGKYNEELQAFAESNGFRAEQILCASEEEQLKLVEEGKADAMLRRDTGIKGLDMRVIARFGPRPFYMAVNKENKELLGELNQALEIIHTTNPYFMADLYEEYFSGKSGMVLSESEQNYISRVGSLRAGALLGKAPLQYRSSEGELKGISFGILDHITETTGLEFEVIPFDTWQEYEKALQNGQLDIVVGVNGNYDMARSGNYTLTLPYLHAPLFVAMNQNVGKLTDLEDKKLALQKGYIYRGKAPSKVQTFDTMEDCLNAVHNGQADYCYGNSYCIQYYMEGWKKSNINTFSMSEDWSQEYEIGIIKPADPMLVSIINKSIKAIPDDLLNHLLFENAFDKREVTFSEYAMRNPEQVTVWLLLFCLATLAVVFVSLEWNRRLHAARKALENERYEQLSALSNEFLYEYDVKQGCFKLTEQTSGFLGCPKVVKQWDLKENEKSVFQFMTSAEKASVEHECILPDGRKRWLKFVSKMISDVHGKPWYAVGKIVDIQQEREIRNQLQFKAERDSMTNIYNSATSRRLIKETINEKKSGAMIIMDVDYFKQVNDSMGHYTGDQVLCEIAGILLKSFRPDDIVGRLGGDEFVVFMNSTKDQSKVQERCEEVLRLVKDITHRLHGRTITMSIGGAMVREDDEYDVLYRRTDQALYEVKNRGRNGIHVV